jgi:hypothetical protein
VLIDATMKLAGPNTRLIPGHGTIINRTDIVPYRDIILGVQATTPALCGNSLASEAEGRSSVPETSKPFSVLRKEAAGTRYEINDFENSPLTRS